MKNKKRSEKNRPFFGGRLNEDRTACNFECEENQFLNPQTGECTSCNLSNSVVSSQEECNRCAGSRFWHECLSCPNRYWTGTVLYSGSCHYCDGQVSADGKSCIK